MTNDVELVPVIGAELLPCPVCGEQPRWRGTAVLKLAGALEHYARMSDSPLIAELIERNPSVSHSYIACMALDDARKEGLIP